ncbi:hypothetical protein CHS0354_015509 [Potamilus streckersoni]|uniref:Uncharacterized protein n=1 Tax=Potamilus streckersoni TaxID=2493646 RepID=A0AAE0SYE1_9BIVA|nr:hypothetical protein CHS0354_015509 [Potamilus streckersoni]
MFTNLSSVDMQYHLMLGDVSDWMLAERIKPRSPLASPETKSSQGEGLYFNFSSGSQTDKKETCQLSSVSANTPRKRIRKRLFDADSFPGIGEGQILSSPVNCEEFALYAIQPSIDNVNISGLKHTEVDIDCEATNTKSYKRQLEEEGWVETKKKRQRRDWTRVFGLRYLKQLKEDVNTLRMKLKRQGMGVSKPVDCTCTVMERHFLQMAESAYRSLRRMDCSPGGFQQFKTELIQTNAVILDSLEVLRNIKNYCEHKY